MKATDDSFEPEWVAISSLRPHPRNYRVHGEDQLLHLAESIREHGVYRNVVVARDGTILAGHGVVLAAQKTGLESIPVIRLDVDPGDPRALKVLVGDNEVARFAEVDDRALTEMLRRSGNRTMPDCSGRDSTTWRSRR